MSVRGDSNTVPSSQLLVFWGLWYDNWLGIRRGWIQQFWTMLRSYDYRELDSNIHSHDHGMNNLRISFNSTGLIKIACIRQ